MTLSLGTFTVSDPGQAAALLSVWGRIAERQADLSSLNLVRRLPYPDTFDPHAVWFGSFTRYVPATKSRWIQKDVAVHQGDIVASPTDLARFYIEAKYPKRLRATGRQVRFFSPQRIVPLYAQVGSWSEEHVYIDVKSAYWSILRVLGWDVEYFPSGLLVKRSDVSDFPYPDNKVARSALVSMGLPGDALMYHKGRLKPVSIRRNVNLGLWSAVQDVLHGIAAESMRYADVKYINTDGLIVPANQAEDVKDVIRSWGLWSTEKYRGCLQVFGSGAYNIGVRLSKHAARIARSHDNVNRDTPPDLKRTFAYLADRVDRDR